jgi:hypothetical protein
VSPEGRPLHDRYSTRAENESRKSRNISPDFPLDTGGGNFSGAQDSNAKEARHLALSAGEPEHAKRT